MSSDVLFICDTIIVLEDDIYIYICICICVYIYIYSKDDLYIGHNIKPNMLR
jgi:hypothetical protein